MKPELTQGELAQLVREDKTAIWQFTTLFLIDCRCNLGKDEYYLREMHHNPKGRNVSTKGRFLAMTPEHAQQFIECE
jgi:hypothetical protein